MSLLYEYGHFSINFASRGSTCPPKTIRVQKQTSYQVTIILEHSIPFVPLPGLTSLQNHSWFKGFENSGLLNTRMIDQYRLRTDHVKSFLIRSFLLHSLQGNCLHLDKIGQKNGPKCTCYRCAILND